MNRGKDFRIREDAVYERIYAQVRRIPKGKVATYGQIARIVGRCTARMVGYAMAALRGRTDVPWQRVINFQGGISPRACGDGSVRQRKLLEREGIRFNSRGRLDLKKYRWDFQKVRGVGIRNWNPEGDPQRSMTIDLGKEDI